MTAKFLLIGASNKLYMGIGCRGHNCDFEYYDKQMEKVYLHLLDVDTKDKHELVMWGSEGQCGSGWTTASWGHFTFDKVDSFTNPPSMFIEPTMVVVEKNEDSIEVLLDGFVSDDKDDHSNTIAYCNYCGCDDYYPNGWYTFNKDLFTVSPRAVDRMKVYVFKGPSAIGKSYLASQFKDTFKVYETDSSKELPTNLSAYDVVVVGNKYEFPELIELLKTNRDVVNVNFS